MSDYDDEEFENYDDDDFEAEDEYDVIPAGKPAKVATPSDSPKVVRGVPQRASYAGNHRPPSANTGRTAATVQVPLFAGLTDAQRRSAMKKLAAGLARMPQLKLAVVAMEDFPQLQALNQFELYSMGRSKYSTVKVAKTQTHEDDKEQDMQTEEVESQAYGCQVPDDRNVQFDGEYTAAGLRTGGGGGGGVASRPADKALKRITAMAPDQENKLLGFMRWAGPMMLAALGMNPTVKKLALNQWTAVNDAAAGLSGGRVVLQHEVLLNQRPVTGTAYCQGNAPLLLAAYAPVGAQLGAAALLQDHSISSKGLMVAWDLSASSSLGAVCVSEGSPACCCWAPGPSTSLVFAGMEEGGVCAWDLDEPEGRHPMEEVGGQYLLTRRPSYSTEFLADAATTAAPVVGIATTPSTENRSRPCQLIALNGWGTVTVFTVTILPPSDKNAADVDLGLRPGSRLKLVRTSQLNRLGMASLRPPLSGKLPTMDQVVQAFALQLLPDHARQFVVGSDCGKVLRGSWVGLPPPPKEYVADDHKSTLANCPSSPAEASSITTLHGSPFLRTAFLAGHSNGSIVLHSVDSSAAAAVWLDVSKAKIMVVRWSPTRPAVFFALDALCTLYTFDLTQSTSGPIGSQSCMMQDGKQVPSVPSFFETSCVQTGEAVKAAGAAPPGTPSYCVGYDDGMLEVHLFSGRFAAASQGELQLLQGIVGTAPAPAATNGKH